MKENIFELVLQAESEYLRSQREAAYNVDSYKEKLDKKHGDLRDSMEHDWFVFEREMDEKYAAAYIEREQELESANDKKKSELLSKQNTKIEEISDRIMKEVLL